MACLSAALAGGCHSAEIVLEGQEKVLREPMGRPSPGSGILVIAFDGLGRDILYDELEAGKLPNLARVLGGREGGRLPHATLERDAVTTFPSATAVAWSAAFTGKAPAQNGVTGNEMFLRPSRRFVAPVPMSVSDNDHLLRIYTEGFFAQLLEVPTMYERMHTEKGGVLAWVSLNHVHQGADLLLMPGSDDTAEGLVAWTSSHMHGPGEREVFAEIDKGAIDAVVDALDHRAAPDVLTLYFSGTDTYAHVAQDTHVQRKYLHDVVDPSLEEVADRLAKRGSWYTLVVADHGHTAIRHDDRHSLDVEGEDEPPEVLRRAGFTPRPSGLEISDEPYDTVLAYQGGCAYVYLADRSRCDTAPRCDWDVPPRYREDVLAAAEAFHRANSDGAGVPELKGTLDMILVREPVPFDAVDAPFRAYVGGGKSIPVEELIAAHQEVSGPRFALRLWELGVGRHGERAGDVVLVARHSTAEDIDGRYYFSRPYSSSHGSNAEEDSAIPFIVAHTELDSATLSQRVSALLGDRPRIRDVTLLVLAMRQWAREEK